MNEALTVALNFGVYAAERALLPVARTLRYNTPLRGKTQRAVQSLAGCPRGDALYPWLLKEPV